MGTMAAEASVGNAHTPPPSARTAFAQPPATPTVPGNSVETTDAEAFVGNVPISRRHASTANACASRDVKARDVAQTAVGPHVEIARRTRHAVLASVNLLWSFSRATRRTSAHP